METRKITVKHYLNKRAKPRTYRNRKYYPLYIQLIVEGKKAQIKSRINEHLYIYRSEIDQITNRNKDLDELILSGYFSESQLEKIESSRQFPLCPLMHDEVAVIKKIIELHKPFESRAFSLKNFSAEYEKNVREITDILDEKIKEHYLTGLREIFYNSTNKPELREIFNISNFLIHFINWEKSFYNFYELTYEVLPSEIRKVEKLLRDELKMSIRAFMAFHSKVNILKRYLEKKERGRISTLSYLDWITEIRSFLEKEFVKIFGSKKGKTYVNHLNQILVREIED